MLKNLFPLTFKQSSLIWFPIVFLGLALDQITKYIALTQLHQGFNIKIFSGFDLALVYNYGAAFGFLNQGETWQILLLMCIAVIAVTGFGIWLARIPRENHFEGLGITLIISGALGNLIDRFYHGYVIDFLDVYISTWHWPAFNLADSFICIGAGLVLIQLWFQRSK